MSVDNNHRTFGLHAGSASSAAACPNGNGMSNTLVRNATHYSLTATSCPQYSPYGQKTPNTPSYKTTTVVRPTMIRHTQGRLLTPASFHACAI